MQDTRFGHFHAAGVAGSIVVMTAQVQGAMNHEMRQMMCHAPAGRRRFSPYDAKRQHDFRRGGFVCQNVGRFVSSAVSRVQAPDEAIAGQHHIHFTLARRESAA